MRTILNLMDSIANVGSTNAKLDMLVNFFKSDFLDHQFCFIKFVYDPNINFFMKSDRLLELDKKNPAKSLDSENDEENLMKIYNTLHMMKRRDLSEDEVFNFFVSLSDIERKLFIKSLDKSLFAGISIKSLEKAYNTATSKFVYPKFPYMRCSLMDKIDKIQYPALSQVKMDGIYVNIFFTLHKDQKVEVELYSRQGKSIDIGSVLRTRLEDYAKKYVYTQLNFETEDSVRFVFMGEALILDNNRNPMDRKTGNGLINSLSKRFTTEQTYQDKLNIKFSKKLSEELANKYREWSDTESNMYFVLWDVMTYDEWQGNKTSDLYTKRFKRLNLMLIKAQTEEHEVKHIFELVESKEVNSYKEAYAHFVECYARGEEGTILKSSKLGWKDGTSQDQVKFKAVKECELKVTGFEYGSGMFSEGIGCLLCESSDGLVKVKVSGMTHSMRGLEPVDSNDSSKGLKVIENFDFEQYNNKIVSVEFNELIKSKDKDSYSLFLPRIVEVRSDKTEADTLDYIQKLTVV